MEEALRFLKVGQGCCQTGKMLASQLAASSQVRKRYYSISEMKFRIYPRRFPLPMVNIMIYNNTFSKVHEKEAVYFHNCVEIEATA